MRKSIGCLSMSYSLGVLVGGFFLPLLLAGCPSSTTAVKQETGVSQVAVLRRKLRSSVTSERVAAARALGRMGRGAEKAIRSLQKALLDREPEVRLAAAKALGEIGEKAVPALLYGRARPDAAVKKASTAGINRLGGQRVAVLTAALKNPLSTIRIEAAKMLGEIGFEAASAAPDLAQLCLKDEENDAKVAAAVALQKMGAEAATASIVKTLGKALKANKSWWRVKVAIANTLGRFGAKSVPVVEELVPLLSDRDKNVYRAAVTALVKIGPGVVKSFREHFAAVPWQAKVRMANIVSVFGAKAASFVPELSQGLRSSDSDVRKATIGALIKMEAAAAPAIPIIISVFSDPQISHENWLGCLRILLSIGDKGVVALKKLLSGDNWSLRKKIVEGLGDLGAGVGKHGVPVLVFALHHKEKEVGWIAAMVLRKLKHKAAPAVPDLVQVLKSKEATSRKLAAKALGAIGFAAKSALPELKKHQNDGNASVRDAVKQAIAAIAAAKPVEDTQAPTPPRPVE